MNTFYYEIPKLFDQVQIESLYYAKTMMSNDGVPLVDEYAVADEDEKFVRLLMKNAAGVEVFNLLAPYTREVEGEGFSFEAVMKDGETEIPDCIIFRCQFPETFDKTVIPALNVAIKNAIVSATLSEFLKKNRSDGNTQKQTFDVDMDLIRSFLSRRINYKRTYKLY